MTKKKEQPCGAQEREIRFRCLSFLAMAQCPEEERKEAAGHLRALIDEWLTLELSENP